MKPGVPEVSERDAALDVVDVHWREAPPTTAVPVVYLHGVPTDGSDWLPFLERTGGYAPDLPGFGRSDKPSHFDYSIAGYARFLDEFLTSRGLERVSLVMHDWGSVGLALAQHAPERIERLVLIDAIPLLPGYRWHAFARIWRTPLGGEMFMGFTFKSVMRRLAHFTVDPASLPEGFMDHVWENFDHGTQRAILKLYRSAPSATLAAAGTRLDQIKAPALIMWGERDPYIAPEFAQRYADALGGESEVEVVDGAGHWPWLDRPELVERVSAFLAA